MTAEVIPLNRNTVIPNTLRWISEWDKHATPENVLSIIWVPYYNIEQITQLETTLSHVSFQWPATRSPDINTIFWVIEEIIEGKDINTIHGFLTDTWENTARARADLQRCWALLQKIAWIQPNWGTINWTLIFSRLKLEQKKAA